MSTEKQPVTVADLVEEAKKRILLLIVCVVGLSYLMSLTSSSVLVNVPAAAILIIILRYFALEFDMRRKSASYNSKPSSASINMKKHEAPKLVTRNSEWRRKVNSPVVEDAIDQFARHLVSEWVTDLWYSRITPDRQGPEELVRIINVVLAEISCRMRNVNLIDLLTRDIIKLFCAHLDLFRACHVKIQKRQMGSLTIGQRDIELKYILAAQNKLHPALFSTDAEHKVLQYLMEDLISLTFKPDDLHCSLFRYIMRELLSCAVMRPVLNLANPRFINERIEGVVLSRKADKVQMVPQAKPSESPKVSTIQISRSQDPSVKGVELMQVNKDEPNSLKDIEAENLNGTLLSKDPLLSISTRSTRSWSSLPLDSQTGDGICIQRQQSGGEWGDRLDAISRRKTEALAPEHFENVWAKGRNYKKKEGTDNSALPVREFTSAGSAKPVDNLKSLSKYRGKGGAEKVIATKDPALLSGGAVPHGGNLYPSDNRSKSGHPSIAFFEEDNEDSPNSDDTESESSSSFLTDEENSNITGLDTPSIKVWDGRNNRNQSVARIHHPLEVSKGHKARKASKGRSQSQRMARSQSGRKKARSSSHMSDVWQEVERTSVSMGEVQDILIPSKGQVRSDGSSGDSEVDLLRRTNSGATATSSVSSISIPESHSLTLNSPVSSLLADSFLTLRCEVVAANIVKSGSSTFAVYSISVTDVENKSWSIKRRFRHFEELHRRLKEYPEYTLHLPPKHFLSTGLDVPVIRERCKLLDVYLKKLLQLPTISGSIEVWDFLSVDSQTYSFSDSLSIIETLSGTSNEKKKEIGDSTRAIRHSGDNFSSKRGLPNSGMKNTAPQMTISHVTDLSRMNTKNVAPIPPEKPAKAFGKSLEDSSKKNDKLVQDRVPLDSKLGANVKEAEIYHPHPTTEPNMDGGIDPALPSDWIPPNLSVPILDLVDVLFQLKDGGWIRRKAFWVAKQVLQLGMGDAFDDWLIDKIQILRRGSVVASGIRRVEQILWPDGIFITKHPKRQRPAPSSSPYNSPHGQPPTTLSSPKQDDIQTLDELQEKEARRREQFVYELMIDNAPAALVGLVGRKEYDHCAMDLFYFLQSSVCLKQLAFGILELLLLSAFPEMENTFRQLHEDKERFGELKQS